MNSVNLFKPFLLVLPLLIHGCDPWPGPPNAPSDLTLSYVHEGARLQWKDNSYNELGFIIYQRPVDESSWVRIGATGDNRDYYTATTDHFSCKYSYKVAAYLRSVFPQGRKVESSSNIVNPPEPATLPFYESFEDISLGPYWSKYSRDRGGSDEVGNIEVITDEEPHTGSYHLLMDSAGTDGNTNALVLTIDLSGCENVVLSFWIKWRSALVGSVGELYPCTDYQSDLCNGVLVSADGETWDTLTGLPSEVLGITSYTEYVIDLDEAANKVGVSFDPYTKLKFVHYVSEYSGLAGWTDRAYTLDDISITEGDPVP